MKYKPFLLKSAVNETFTFIYADPDLLNNSPSQIDSMYQITDTKNSPLKKIVLKKSSDKIFL